MKRRDFLGAVAAGAFSVRHRVAFAEQPTKARRVGIIGNGPLWDYFRDRLRDLGDIDGQNITIETRPADGNPDRLMAAAWADASQTQPVNLNIVAIDRQGLVRDIGDLLASEKISIEMMHTTTDRTQSTATIDVRVAIDDAAHLARLLQRIRKLGSVLSVRRTA